MRGRYWIFVWAFLLKTSLAGARLVRRTAPELNLRNSGKQPISNKGGKWLIKEGKRPIKADGLFSRTPAMVENAPLKSPLRGLWAKQEHPPNKKKRSQTEETILGATLGIEFTTSILRPLNLGATLGATPDVRNTPRNSFWSRKEDRAKTALQ